jgi:hypothetical protein
MKTYQYFVAGQVVTLQSEGCEIAVRYQESLTRAGRRSCAEAICPVSFAERIEVPGELYTMLPMRAAPEELASLVSKFQAAEDVVRATTVFRSGSHRVYAADRVLVGLRAGVSRELLESNAEVARVEHVAAGDFIVHLHEGRDPLALTTVLAGQPGVDYAEPDWVIVGDRVSRGLAHPQTVSGGSDPLAPLQYCLDITQARRAWERVTPSREVRIAILDEGVETTHRDLRSAIVGEYDAVDNDDFQEPKPWDAHGTACAGLAAAVPENGVGIRGIAGGCSLLAVRIAYSRMPGGRWSTSCMWITRGIEWAWRVGKADILSNSWANSPPSSAMISAFNRARAEGRGGKGCVVVVAAGNNDRQIGFPANLEGVLTVSASNKYDEPKTKISHDGETWWGSSFGARVDVAAPGVGNLTTDISGAKGYNTGGSWLSSDFVENFNGTSSSTPIVAGVAALVLSKNSSLREEQVREIITRSADKVGDVVYDASREHNERMGFGRVNALRAVELA